MKRIAFASLALVMATSFAGSASAADIPVAPVPKAPYAAPPPPYSWTGAYFGINGGATFGDIDVSTPAGTNGYHIESGLIGVTLGYNWQTGFWVWGLEGDIGYTNVRGSTSSLACWGCSFANTWLATVRGRLGYAMNNVMPYITGGLAVGDVGIGVTGFPGIEETRAGWTIGGGLEFALFGNWTAKAEYLYVDLGTTSCGAAACGLPAPVTADFRTHVVRAGLNVRF